MTEDDALRERRPLFVEPVEDRLTRLERIVAVLRDVVIEQGKKLEKLTGECG